VVETPRDRVYTDVDDRRRMIVEVIRGARREIDLSVFRCTDHAIFDELRRATGRGVKVNALLTPRARGGAKSLRALWTALAGTGASLHTYAEPLVKYHAKYLVADDGPAMVGSFNFTRKCFERTCDAFVLTHDPAVVSGLRQLIAADRDGRPMPPSLTPRVIVGPERSRGQLTSLIEQAQSSIRLIDAKLSDPDLVRLLDARRADGLTVEVYDTRRLGGLKSHGKILLIDDRLAVIGSMAITPLGLDFRREVALIVTERDAVAHVARLFRTIAFSADGARMRASRQMNDTLTAPIVLAGAGEEAQCSRC
jgi:phosphatidylserine/phosphatidylglycerophosphate/cardiolipin synthase-like enzyme